MYIEENNYLLNVLFINLMEKIYLPRLQTLRDLNSRLPDLQHCNIPLRYGSGAENYYKIYSMLLVCFIISRLQ